MSDVRRKNINWRLPAPPEALSYEAASLAVLMDARDELQSINQILRCPNFTRFPYSLERIARNTAKPRKKKARAA